MNPMSGKKMNRRDFVASGAAFGMLGFESKGGAGAPQIVTRGVRPVVIASGNGNRSKDKDGIPLEPLLS
jgi:hypothetical protein